MKNHDKEITEPNDEVLDAFDNDLLLILLCCLIVVELFLSLSNFFILIEHKVDEHMFWSNKKFQLADVREVVDLVEYNLSWLSSLLSQQCVQFCSLLSCFNFISLLSSSFYSAEADINALTWLATL